jgi:hypothetical protein
MLPKLGERTAPHGSISDTQVHIAQSIWREVLQVTISNRINVLTIHIISYIPLTGFS